MNQQQTDKPLLTIETQLKCLECGLVAVSTFEIFEPIDGKGFIVCYECGERQPVEVP